MVEYLLISSIAIILAALSKHFKFGLETAIILLACFIGLRYDYGNDTAGYMAFFEELSDYNYSIFEIGSILRTNNYYEYGWILLCYVFQPLGFFGLQFVLASIEMFVIYKFIKEFVPNNYFWLAILIFTFTPSFMFIGACSMMRQWLACIIFLYSTIYIRSHRFLPYLLFVFIAASFHRSAFLLIPFYLLGYIGRIKFSIIKLICVIPLIVLWYYVASEYSYLLDHILLAVDFEHYTRFTDRTIDSFDFTLFGLLATFFMPLFSASTIKIVDNKYVLFIYLCLLSLLITPLSSYAMMISRMSIYFTIINIFLYPYIVFLVSKKDKILSIVLMLIIILPSIRQIFAIFYNPTWHDAYFDYQTFISLLWK